MYYMYICTYIAKEYSCLIIVSFCTNPYLLHNAVYLVTILPSQRTPTDCNIGVSREVLVVTTVVQDLLVVRVWWDDVSWQHTVRDFAMICGWFHTYSNKHKCLFWQNNKLKYWLSNHCNSDLYSFLRNMEKIKLSVLNQGRYNNLIWI